MASKYENYRGRTCEEWKEGVDNRSNRPYRYGNQSGNQQGYWDELRFDSEQQSNQNYSDSKNRDVFRRSGRDPSIHSSPSEDNCHYQTNDTFTSGYSQPQEACYRNYDYEADYARVDDNLQEQNYSYQGAMQRVNPECNYGYRAYDKDHDGTDTYMYGERENSHMGKGQRG